ncbi:MAG: flagellar biosynthetic protein FliR [Vampirovibrionales bacterium]|nr:flagellar biosynthetic protein FliR [Vampirovibrionales bacterium]
MAFEAALGELWSLYGRYGATLDTFLLVLARVLGFVTNAPILGRKDFLFFGKLTLSIMLSVMLTTALAPKGASALMSASDGMVHSTLAVFLMVLATNAVIGAILGFIINMLFEVITSAGDLINSQLGMSSAMMFDPSARRQVMLLEPLFGFIALVIFFEIGGMGWLLKGLWHSFELFSVYDLNPNLFDKIDLQAIVDRSGLVVEMATLIMAPVLLVTLSVDIMLAIVNRAAQQIPVFQLSFGLKPAIGLSVLLISLPTMVEMIIQFFEDNQKLF